jgi:regulator of PEP synthase PpsR (kinase-PPPase family)
MRETAERLAIEYQVQTHDLFGPLLASFGGFLDQVPVGVPGILHRADAYYYKRIEAVEFTVRADDGKDPRLLSDADVVLVGVSRTSKTPLSTFLAHKGLKVSNQPIVLNRPLPDQLFEIDQGRIFALTIDANALQNIRQVRLETMRMPKGTNYGDMAYILAELEFANDLFRGNPTWPVLDVTNRAIEETAAHIARRLRDRGYMAPLGGDFPI